MSTETNQFAVKWVSPRGFANEGDYVYGSLEALRDDEVVQMVRRSDGGRITTMSYHRTLDNARLAAEKLLRKDRDGRAGWGEQSYDGVRQAGAQW